MRRALGLARWAVVTELRMYAAGARLLTRRHDVPEGARALPYTAATALLLWVITAVSLIELVALHLVLPWETVRLVADVLGIWGVVWCLGYTASLYVYPHLADAHGLALRVQHRRATTTVPWASVASVRVRERSLEGNRPVRVEGRTALVTVAGRTNLELVLRTSVAVRVPVGVGGHRGHVAQEVDEVHLYVDEPRQVAALVRRHTGGGATSPI